MLAGASALALVLAGCGTGSNSSTGNATSSQTPQKGGTLVSALPASTDITWYLPISNVANQSLYNAQMNEMEYWPLLYLDNKYNIDYNDSIAKNIVASSDGLTYHVYLHNNYKWSDGQPVTTKDILFTWNVIKAASASNAPSPWPYVDANYGDIPNGIKSIVANNDYEFTITLKKPANQQWFEYNGIGQLIPMPAHAWDKYPNDMTQELKYLGQNATDPNFIINSPVDGAFKLTSATDKEKWVLTPNKYFGGHKSTLDKWVLVYEASSDAEIAAVKSGAVNLGYLPLTQYSEENQLKSSGITITPMPNGFGYFDVTLNMNKGSKLGSVFSQLYVRQALEMGIDQNTINSKIWHNYAPPQYGPIPADPATKFLDPKLSKPLYPYNPAKGKQLLEQHGWKEVNGVMTKDGQQLAFTLMYPSGDETVTQTAELEQQDWAQEGVKVTLKPLPFAQLLGYMAKPTGWDAASEQGIAYSGSYPSGDGIFQPGGLDNYGYNDATENQWITKTTEPSPNEQAIMKTFFGYEEYTAKNLPVLWSNGSDNLVLTASNVHNATEQTMDPAFAIPMINYIWMSK
ncbi:peptide ABC transporter substrate-binding protein [Alicyclobacillus cycloheptanicus]|nr:peptide ABC transporter substrate-binding protein [Alicyclobacillus cycloheptanicus]